MENVSWYVSYSESFYQDRRQYKKLTASSAALNPDVYESTEIGVNYDLTPDVSLSKLFDSEQTIATRDESGEGEIVGLQVME